MKIHKKTLWASFVAFFIGTSCCWLSSLVIWIGGLSALGTIVSYVESSQILILSIVGILLLISLFLYFKSR